MEDCPQESSDFRYPTGAVAGVHLDFESAVPRIRRTSAFADDVQELEQLMSERFEGVPIVLTAPLTESIDHAGFFIQMALGSIPGWMEWAIDRKYPAWRNVPTSADGSAGTAPAGLRVLETVLAGEFGSEAVVVCYPDQLSQFIGTRTRVVGVSTHNPLGTTFAGVYASI